MKGNRFIGLLSCVALIGSLLTGCGSNTPTVSAAENNNFIAIVGNHSGSLIPTYSTCERAVMGACKAEGSLCVIVADGAPYLATGDVIDIPKQQNNLSASKLKSIYMSQTEQILTLMKTSYAKTEEVDLLKALNLCAREAQSSQFSKGSTEIYIYDAGVSTKYLNMTMLDLDYVDAESVVSILQEKNMIPDLSNLGKIHWFNLGDVDYEIDNAKIDGIKKIWTAIIEAGGGHVEFYTDPSTTEFDVELPYVSEIPNTMNAIEWPTTSADVEEIEVPIVFTESEVGFKPGAVSFMDEDKAAETLSAVTDFLKDNTDEKILIAATTADWGTSEYQSNLSADRAETIKNYLIKAGIDEDRMTTVGLGSSSGFYKYDHNSDGSLNERIASKNRSIVIMDVNSKRAEQILEGKFEKGELYE